MSAPRDETEAPGAPTHLVESCVLPTDRRSREERALKLAGYSDAQIAKLLARTLDADDVFDRRAA